MSDGKDPEEEQTAPVVLTVKTIAMKFEALPTALWLSFSFAPEWYEDALWKPELAVTIGTVVERYYLPFVPRRAIS